MLLNEFIVMPQLNVNPWAFLLWRVSETTFYKLPKKGKEEKAKMIPTNAITVKWLPAFQHQIVPVQ